MVRIIFVLAILSGCVDVKPWQKGDLARHHMLLDPTPYNARFAQHIYQSKESSFGGYGIGGGGCGCN